MLTSIKVWTGRPATRCAAALLGLLALYLLGVGMRLHVLQAQLDVHGEDLPFTLESALEFRYVRMLYAGEGIPAWDYMIQAPEGVAPRKTYTLGAEYVYALVARCLPASWSLTRRVRLASVWWFCLGIPFVCLWLWWWLRSACAAACGGAYYAVGLASVMRSTGQELSHENFALPILAAALALGALAGRAPRRAIWWMASLGTAALLAWSLTAWDLIQFYVMIWTALHYARLLGRTYFRDRRRAACWSMTLAALLLAGIVDPYLRSHAFWRSPALLAALGMLPGVWRRATARAGAEHLGAWRALLPPALCLLALSWAGGYGAAYGHFGELLAAKVRFLNRKPADPALLTFDQRILWVPALHSANWVLTKLLFPATIPLIAISVILILVSARRRSDPETIHLIFCWAVVWPAFWLFVRLHVFVAILAAVSVGWLGWWSMRQRSGMRTALLIWLMAALTAEGLHTARDALRWGSDPGYLELKRELLDWMEDNLSKDTILANFGISAYVLAYGGFPIVLHPKFESAAIRTRVREYGEHLFKKPERDLRDWTEQFDARYFIYSLGEFADIHVDCQMRYFVDALEPPPAAAARIFEFQPRRGRYFVYLWGNAKYRVFRIITRDDQQTSVALAGHARQNLAAGAWDEAERLARLALLYDPHNIDPAQIILRLDGLR